MFVRIGMCEVEIRIISFDQPNPSFPEAPMVHAKELVMIQLQKNVKIPQIGKILLFKFFGITIDTRDNFCIKINGV